MRMAHPDRLGQFIRMEIIESLGLSATRAAEILDATRPVLSALLNGQALLSPGIALRIEKAFGPKMDTLFRMQTAYDIGEVRDREGNIKAQRYAGKPHADQQRALSPPGTLSSEIANLIWLFPFLQQS
jgi:antitoxin HigA-1